MKIFGIEVKGFKKRYFLYIFLICFCCFLYLHSVFGSISNYRNQLRGVMTDALSQKEYIREKSGLNLNPSFLKRQISNNNVENQALLCAKYSTMVSMSVIKKAENGFHDLKRTIEKGGGNCSEISTITYMNFVGVAIYLNMPEILDYLRICIGHKYRPDRGDWGGHMWLEIKRKGKWVPFEPSIGSYLGLFGSSNLKGEDISKIKSEDVLPGARRYRKKASFQVLLDRPDHLDICFLNFIDPRPKLDRAFAKISDCCGK